MNTVPPPGALERWGLDSILTSSCFLPGYFAPDGLAKTNATRSTKTPYTPDLNRFTPALTINWIYENPKFRNLDKRNFFSEIRIMIRFSFRRPVLGGIIFALAMGFATYTFGEISGFQAWELLTTSSSGISTLCYIIIVGSIYILVMLLHLLSIRVLKINHLRLKYYNDLLNIARIATLLIICSTIVLLVLNIPFTKTKIFSYSEYFKIYYTILTVASVLAGGFIALITMIYQSIRNIISDKKGEHNNQEAELHMEEPRED